MNLQAINLNAFKRPVVLITLAVVVLAAALWWFLWMEPEGNKLSTANAQVAQEQSTLTTLRQNLFVDERQAAKVQEYAGYLQMFAAAVPPIPEAPQLTTELANLADMTNVHLVTLSDDTTVTGTPLGTIPISMEIEGPRQDCMAFLSGLYNQKMITRLITVSGFTPTPVNSGGAGSNVLQASNALYTAQISAAAYYDPDIDPSGAAPVATTTATASSTQLPAGSQGTTGSGSLRPPPRPTP